MILYHISNGDLNYNAKFIPRIPIQTLCNEDTETSRICVADSIEGCLSAMPSGGKSLEDSSFYRRYYYRVYEIDTEKYGIPDEDIYYPEYLYENGLVDDSISTGEHWILNELEVDPADSYLIKLISWDEECIDVVPFKILDEALKHYEGDYTNVYAEAYGCDVETSTIISNLHYSYAFAGSSNPFSIMYDTDDELYFIENLLNSMNNIRYSIKYNDINIYSTTYREVDMEDFVLKHYNYEPYPVSNSDKYNS